MSSPNHLICTTQSHRNIREMKSSPNYQVHRIPFGREIHMVHPVESKHLKRMSSEELEELQRMLLMYQKIGHNRISVSDMRVTWGEIQNVLDDRASSMGLGGAGHTLFETYASQEYRSGSPSTSPRSAYHSAGGYNATQANDPMMTYAVPKGPYEYDMPVNDPRMTYQFPKGLFGFDMPVNDSKMTYALPKGFFGSGMPADRKVGATPTQLRHNERQGRRGMRAPWRFFDAEQEQYGKQGYFAQEPGLAGSFKSPGPRHSAMPQDYVGNSGGRQYSSYPENSRAGPRRNRSGSINSPLDWKKNPYAILGLNPSCTAADLQIAKKRLALLYHPDRIRAISGTRREEASQKMADINAAADFLSDSIKRKWFDRLGDMLKAEQMAKAENHVPGRRAAGAEHNVTFFRG